MINTLNIEYVVLILIYIYLIFFVDLNNNTKILFTIIIILLCNNKFLKNNILLETYEKINKLTKKEIDILEEDENQGFDDLLEYTFDGDDKRDLYIKNLRNYKDKLSELEEIHGEQNIDIEEEYNTYLDQIDQELDIIEEDIDISSNELNLKKIKLENDRKMLEIEEILKLAKNKIKYHDDIEKEEIIYSEQKEENNTNRLFNKMIGEKILKKIGNILY